MSDPVLVALIVAAQGVLVGGVNAWMATRNHTENKAAIGNVEQKVENTRKSIDGRMDQLLVAAHAEGAQTQRAETRVEAKEDRAEAKQDRVDALTKPPISE